MNILIKKVIELSTNSDSIKLVEIITYTTKELGPDNEFTVVVPNPTDQAGLKRMAQAYTDGFFQSRDVYCISFDGFNGLKSYFEPECVGAGSKYEPDCVNAGGVNLESCVIPVSTPVVKVEESSEDSSETYDSIHKALVDIDEELSNIQKRRVQLNKIVQKKFTQLSKQHKKRSKSDGKSTKCSVSGFNKPAYVPASFCELLGLNPGEQLPRTIITDLLYKSIKEKNLLN